MTLPKRYTTGTVTVGAGGTVVTGVGTAWAGTIEAGDIFARAGYAVDILSVDSNTQLTLAEGWPGTALSGSAYGIRIVGDGPERQLKARQIAEQLSAIEANSRGLFYLFDTAITDADPGNGKLRFNNATISSATACYIDNLDANAATVSGDIDTWDDGTSAVKGKLWVRSVARPEVFYAFNVTGSVVDGTGYRKLTLTYVGGSGTLNAADELMVFFAPKGDAGQSGSAGIILAYDTATADADPGAGKFRLNNATPASATAAYIDNVEAQAGASITALLDSWDDSNGTVKGQLKLINVTDPTIFRIFNVTGSVVDGTGYRKLTIANSTGAGTFVNGAQFALSFIPTGNDGFSPGYRLTFDGASQADSDPGAGKARFNNATFASISFVYVDNADQGGTSLTTWLDGLDDNVNANARAYLRFEKATDPTVYAEFAVTDAVVDGTGYRKIPVSPVAGAVPADATVLVATASKSGRDGNAGVDGTGLFSRVRVVATTNVATATGLESGDTVDGVALATNDLVLLTGQTAPAENGIYVVSASGAASRDSSYDTYDEHPGVYISAMEGAANADTLWRCTSNKGGTLGTTALAFEKFRSGADVFSRADPYTVAFTKTGAGTISIKAGTVVEVNKTVYTFAAAAAVAMPALTAGTDYAIWIKPDGTLEATTNFTSPPIANSRKIGGFHYAPGGNASAQAGGDTTPAINAYSLWDIKFRPACPDPRGMALIADGFWCDIYLLGVDHLVNGTSKYNVTIADGLSPPKIPTLYGGNGSTAYGTLTWWEAAEVLASHGKQPLSYAEYAAAMYGTTENSSGGTDPVSTILRAAYTSKWGVMLASGNLWVWGDEFGGPDAGAAWANTNGGRGQVYQQSNAVLLGGAWDAGAYSGSRASLWANLPSFSAGNVGARGRCDHLNHV